MKSPALLAACEGALLVVDAAQGVQAQSLANVHLALDRNLEIVPVINKIDLPTADIEGVRTQIEDVIGIDASDAICCSAKSGIGIEEILERIIDMMSLLQKNLKMISCGPCVRLPLRQLPRRHGLYPIISGEIRKGSLIKMMATDKNFEVLEVGVFTPKENPVDVFAPAKWVT